MEESEIVLPSNNNADKPCRVNVMVQVTSQPFFQTSSRPTSHARNCDGQSSASCQLKSAKSFVNQELTSISLPSVRSMFVEAASFLDRPTLRLQEECVLLHRCFAAVDAIVFPLAARTRGFAAGPGAWFFCNLCKGHDSLTWHFAGARGGNRHYSKKP